jgi:hypothetical protein
MHEWLLTATADGNDVSTVFLTESTIIDDVIARAVEVSEAIWGTVDFTGITRVG